MSPMLGIMLVRSDSLSPKSPCLTSVAPAIAFHRFPWLIIASGSTFTSPWFRAESGGAGGPGTRVFDVACNGEVLLKNFDILAQGNSARVVKEFDNIQASAGGRIELSFTPVLNYAVINAIEVPPAN